MYEREGCGCVCVGGGRAKGGRRRPMQPPPPPPDAQTQPCMHAPHTHPPTHLQAHDARLAGVAIEAKELCSAQGFCQYRLNRHISGGVEGEGGLGVG